MKIKHPCRLIGFFAATLLVTANQAEAAVQEYVVNYYSSQTGKVVGKAYFSYDDATIDQIRTWDMGHYEGYYIVRNKIDSFDGYIKDYRVSSAGWLADPDALSLENPFYDSGNSFGYDTYLGNSIGLETGTIETIYINKETIGIVSSGWGYASIGTYPYDGRFSEDFFMVGFKALGNGVYSGSWSFDTYTLNSSYEYTDYYSDNGGWVAYPTPLPTALPLFVTGLGAISYIGAKKRKPTI